MKTIVKRENNSKSKSKNKQTETNISKKLHKIWQHKGGANILIKLIRLMEVTGRHAKINLLFEKQIYHNGSINFGLLEFEIHGNAEFEHYII